MTNGDICLPLQHVFDAAFDRSHTQRAGYHFQLIAAQGKPVDMGGYYHPDFEKTSKAMRPSATLNAALALIA